MKGRYQAYCSRCGQGFASEQSLQRHLQRVRPCTAVVSDMLRVATAESARRGIDLNNSSIALLRQYDEQRRFNERIVANIPKQVVKKEDIIHID